MENLAVPAAKPDVDEEQAENCYQEIMVIMTKSASVSESKMIFLIGSRNIDYPILPKPWTLIDGEPQAFSLYWWAKVDHH